MLHTQSIFLTIPSKYTLRWHIPATSTPSMPTSSPCIVIITCSGFPTWKPELAVKSCQIKHSTWQLGHDFLSFWILSVTFSHRLFLTVEPSICADLLFIYLFIFFIFYKCCCITFFFFSCFIWSDCSILDSQHQRFYCLFHFNIFCI